ncbi:MAG: hypothetical protein RXP91_06295 [Nitrososphaeria archaeon]|jgi:hypothetical protein
MSEGKNDRVDERDEEESLSELARELDEELGRMRDDVQRATDTLVSMMHDLRRRPVRRLIRRRMMEVREDWRSRLTRRK